MASLVTLVVVTMLIVSFFGIRRLYGLGIKEAIIASVGTVLAATIAVLIALVLAIVAVTIVGSLILFIYWIVFTIIKLAIKPITIAMLIGGVAIIIVAVIQYIKKRRK